MNNSNNNVTINKNAVKLVYDSQLFSKYIYLLK